MMEVVVSMIEGGWTELGMMGAGGRDLSGREGIGRELNNKQSG
jgi:hypothetical protein